jgi:EAL domain-containing protein (putative c-di-GMP-specific phosphodiesterase class I)
MLGLDGHSVVLEITEGLLMEVGSQVRDLAPDSPELALCEGIVMMAHKLGLKVVAGCDFGQGYLYARPVVAAEFDLSLDAETAR